MSHFTVLVVGPDVDAQLQPFHEFECTGTNDQFVQDVDKTAEVQQRIDDGESLCDALGWFGLSDSIVDDPAKADTTGRAHKYGYAVVRDGKLVKAVDRTNPNKRWDWWLIGGRWTGYFKLQPGGSGEIGEPGLMTPTAAEGRADQALKSSIDFAAMRDEKGTKAGERWDRARALTGGQSWESWETILDRTADIDEARAAYRMQPAVAALKAEKEFSWDIDDTLSGAREAYVQAARNGACATFAIVHKGEWAERGRMGWFACVSDGMNEAEWDRLFNDFIDGLPDDTLLTVVDCHI